MQTVEDPWRPGSYVKPRVPSGPNLGKISYFWPSEWRHALASTSGSGDVDYHAFIRRPVFWTVSALLALVPPGITLFVMGSMSDDPANDTRIPLGGMLLGLGCVSVWWSCSRARVAWQLLKAPPPKQEVIDYVNNMRPFEGLLTLEHVQAELRVVANPTANDQSKEGVELAAKLEEHDKPAPATLGLPQ
eukprot:NODE_11756_length_1266_cov_10.123793.p1 GENE.NODE_11756_length_1266_cov_10.123793~~NODE_11756_length_1266_cov_10.123793.p1  ORF type:complete len:189 (+),score=30.91 NODE_11756_length_1266_cov_10.123793:430-996(+)